MVPEPTSQSGKFGFGPSGLPPQLPLPVVGLLHNLQYRGKRTISNAYHPQTNGEKGEVVVGVFIEPSDGGAMRFLVAGAVVWKSCPERREASSHWNAW